MKEGKADKMQQMRSQEEKWNNAPFKYREAVAWEGRVKDRRVRPPSAWSNTKKRLASPAFPGTRSQERLGHAALRPTGARSPGEDGACAGMVHYPRAWTWIQCFLDVHWRWQNVNGEYLNFENSSAWKLFFFYKYWSNSSGAEVYIQVSFQISTYK